MNRAEGKPLYHSVQENNRGASGKLVKIGLVLLALVGLSGGGAVAYIWFSGGTGQASAALSAPSLEVGSTGRLFHITQDDSLVRFIIDEVLVGKPNTVVGSTNQVAGEIMVDFTHPENTRLGAIRVNLKTLQTDNEFRNRALRGQILLTNRPEFEFASFVPTQLVGLPEKVTLGEPLTFQIVGKLTVREVTREVTFTASLSLVSFTRLTGTARASIHYKDFNIAIPDVPGVADISDEVQLAIDFVAQSSDQ